MQRYNREESEFKEKLVAVNRVTKVVKGGRNFRFSALIVIGDGKGRVGCGMGKAAEIPEAIRKGVEDAKKNLITVPIVGTTIPHEVIGKFGTGSVVLKPAPEVTKSYGTNNPINVVKATIEGLSRLKTAEEVARLRGKSVEELLG